MTDLRRELLEDVVEGIMHGEVAASLAAVAIRRRDDDSLEVDLGDHTAVYLVTFTRIARG